MPVCKWNNDSCLYRLLDYRSDRNNFREKIIDIEF